MWPCAPRHLPSPWVCMGETPSLPIPKVPWYNFRGQGWGGGGHILSTAFPCAWRGKCWSPNGYHPKNAAPHYWPQVNSKNSAKKKRKKQRNGNFRIQCACTGTCVTHEHRWLMAKGLHMRRCSARKRVELNRLGHHWKKCCKSGWLTEPILVYSPNF